MKNKKDWENKNHYMMFGMCIGTFIDGINLKKAKDISEEED